jgi:hypothetical protein
LKFTLHFALKLVLVAFAALGAAFPTLSFGFWRVSDRKYFCIVTITLPGNPFSYPSSFWSWWSSRSSAAVNVFALVYF